MKTLARTKYADPVAGEYRYADGSVFKGFYKDNKKHGLGVAKYKIRAPGNEEGKDSFLMRGLARMKGYAGKVNLTYRDHTRERIFICIGIVILVSVDEEAPTLEATFVGHFVEGQRGRHGCMKYPNGDYYTGKDSSHMGEILCEVDVASFLLTY